MADSVRERIAEVIKSVRDIDNTGDYVTYDFDLVADEILAILAEPDNPMDYAGRETADRLWSEFSASKTGFSIPDIRQIRAAMMQAAKGETSAADESGLTPHREGEPLP